MESSPWDGMSGAPAGPPEWPEAGGYWHQPSRLVHAVSILREEYGRLRAGSSEKKGEKK